MPVNLIKRGNIWHIDDTLGPPGRRIHLRQSTKTTDKTKAQRFATEIETKLWRGHFDGPSATLTFEAACQMYLVDGKSDLFLQPVRDHLGHMLVKDIKPSTIRQMALELYGHCSNTTKNRMGITVPCAVINFAAKAELCSLIRVEPFEDDSEPKEPATMEWVQDFRSAATEILGNYSLFMILTGCRPTEALEVDPVRDLDLKAATCIIRNKKVRGQHRGRRKAHLPEMLVAALANMPREEGRPLFWYKNLKVVRYPWDQAVKRAKIERLTPHCCRHGCATELLRRGVDVVTVGWLIDMTPQMVLETYGHALKDATLTNRLITTELTRAISEVAENTKITGTY